MSAPQVFVTTAAEAAALDARTIERGTPSGELMRRAGEIAAREIRSRFGDELRRGVCVVTGSGNNGGDGWVVARSLSSVADVRVLEAADARTDDAVDARNAAGEIAGVSSCAGCGVVVDALLGTGFSGAPRGGADRAIAAINAARDGGAKVVALDVPSGVDATTGAGDPAVSADLTVTFGTIKRGLLRARDKCGRIVIADIGLDVHASDLPTLITAEEALSLVPPIPAGAHKGSRGGVVVLGGGAGMAGAAMLAGEGCLRSGAGSVRIAVAPDNVAAVHSGLPPALVVSWKDVTDDPDRFLTRWPESVVVGPGLGDDEPARTMLELAIARVVAPLVLDADALNLLTGAIDGMRGRLRAETELVITPHPKEMSRLLGDEKRGGRHVDENRYDVAVEGARRSGAVTLLKGVPTIIASPDGRVRVNATGTPALATGGSGDVLSGIIGALLAQGVAPFDAAIVGAWAHGRAGELATGERTARGVVLRDVVDRLRDVWADAPAQLADNVLAELPPIL